MDIIRWSTPKSDWLYSLQPKTEKLYTSTKTRRGADCGSDHELLITKFRLKLKKVRKIARPFRYDLSQIPYAYTVEVTNRFTGLDVIDRVPEELRTEVCDIVQETGIKIILLWLSGSWRSLLYRPFMYSCHLFLISFASVRSIPFLSFIVPIFVWNVPLASLIF